MDEADKQRTLVDLLGIMRDCHQIGDWESKKLAEAQYMALIGGKAPEDRKAKPTDEDIEAMTQRFLSWELPRNFNPDNGITFRPVVNEGTEFEHRYKPIGTNLLDHTQAKQMIHYVLGRDQ